jgi:hypothetical protein
MEKISWQDFLQMPASRGVATSDVSDWKVLDFQACCRIA